VGIAFGPDVTKRWCTLNAVTGIIRSHEVRQGNKKKLSQLRNLHFLIVFTDGYAIEHDGLCTTVCIWYTFFLIYDAQSLFFKND